MSAENHDAATYDSGGEGRTTVADYVGVLRRRKWWIIVPVALAVGLTLIVSLTSTRLYRTSATVLVTDPPKSAGELPQSLSDKSYRNELNRAQSLPVQRAAREEIGSEPSLSAASGGGNTDLFVFNAESRSPQRAAKAANAYGEAYIKARSDAITESLNAQITGIDEQIKATQEELDALPSSTSPEADALNETITTLEAERDRAQRTVDGAIEANTKLLDPATVPRSAFTPRPVRDGITALILGLIAGLALAFIVDALDQKLRTVRDTERATLLPVLSVVGRLRRWKAGETHLILTEAPTSPQAEAFRALRAKIQFRRMDQPLQTVLITSAEPGDGKSSTAANLALAFAAVGDDTVLVDLDLRRPTLHDYLGLPNGPGAASVLSGGDYRGIYQTSPSVPNLTFVSAGRSRIDASELLAGERLGQFLSVLTERFETVIVDSPPVLAVVDPLSIAQSCDAVLMVVSAGTTDRRKARSAADQLSDALAPTLGVVLNNYTESGTGYGYSYDYEIVDNYVPEREPNSTLEDDEQPSPEVATVDYVPANRVVRTTPPSGYATGEHSTIGNADAERVTAGSADATNPQGVPRPTTFESSGTGSTFEVKPTAFTVVTTAPHTAAVPNVGGSSIDSAAESAGRSNASSVDHGHGSEWTGGPGGQYIGTQFDQNSKQTSAHSSITDAPASSASLGTHDASQSMSGTDVAGSPQSVIEREELLLGALIVPNSTVTSAAALPNGSATASANTDVGSQSGATVAPAGGGFEPLTPDGAQIDTSPTGLERADNEEWEVLDEEQMRASIRSDLAAAIREHRAQDGSISDEGGQGSESAADETTPTTASSSSSATSSSPSKNRRKRRL